MKLIQSNIKYKFSLSFSIFNNLNYYYLFDNIVDIFWSVLKIQWNLITTVDNTIYAAD